MNQKLLLPLLCLTAVASTASAQVFTPKEVSLNVSFDNPPGAVATAMGMPTGPGFVSAESRIYVTAITDPAPPSGARQALKNYAAASSLSAPTTMTVDDTEAGLTYRAQVLCDLKNGQQYYFPHVAGLATTGANPVWNIANTATLIQFQFVDPLNVPVTVHGGIILAQDVDLPLAPSNLNLTDGATGADFLVRGGARVRLTIYADLGGGSPQGGRYRKKFTINTYEATALPSDAVLTIPVTIDSAAATSSLTGKFDVTASGVSANAPTSTDDGFFEINAPTPTPNDGRTDYPILRVIFNAGDGYGNWERHNVFFGTNFLSESSGPFFASNLLATPPPGEGFYSAFGETFLRRTVPGNPPGVYGLQFLRTPGLGAGSNPPPVIAANTTLDTAETFVIKPGTLQGTLTLTGPSVLPGQPAMLAHVARSTNDDTNGDGISDGDVTTWFNGSVLWANGVDAAAPGATMTAAGGQAFIPLPGSFSVPTGTFSGNYSFALGGLNSEASYWKADSLNLSLVNDGNDANTYFSSTFTMTDRRPEATLRREIQTDGTASFDITREFGEVCLTIRSATGTIYQPDIRVVVDDPDYPANAVAVENFAAYGWPLTQVGAASIGTIRTLLPQGTWVITPRVNPGDQPPGSNVDLLPIKVNVPARGRLCIEDGFQIQTEIPECLTGASVSISGTVASNPPVVVTEIRYRIDGGPEVIASNPGVANPSFSIDLSDVIDGTHTITITAVGAGGQLSTISGPFFRNAAGLTIQKAVILTWSCGVLQTSTDMSSWTDVPGATSPFAVPINEPNRFWQVRKP